MPSPGDAPRRSLIQKLALATVPAVSVWAIKALAASCDLEMRGREHFDGVASQGRVIVACWHETLAIALWHYRDKDYVTLASQSFDGELAARAVRRFGFQVVRGSSTRGGLKALVQLQQAMVTSRGLGFTVDGPKGPPRVAKAGIALLAARSGVPIVPNAYSARPAWRLRSWDRFVIPKPFGRLVCAYGEPVPPPADTSPLALENTRLEVERGLNALQDALDREES